MSARDFTVTIPVRSGSRGCSCVPVKSRMNGRPYPGQTAGNTGPLSLHFGQVKGAFLLKRIIATGRQGHSYFRFECAFFCTAEAFLCGSGSTPFVSQGMHVSIFSSMMR
jgi:hypothetical protein